MYLRASQLPQLSAMSYRERIRILIAAAHTHNRWMFVRIAVLVFLMLATTTTINFLPSSTGLPEWSGTAVAVLCGMFFYALLLWELNGPLGKAVAKQLSGGS
jgi:hypothetical protein